MDDDKDPFTDDVVVDDEIAGTEPVGVIDDDTEDGSLWDSDIEE